MLKTCLKILLIFSLFFFIPSSFSNIVLAANDHVLINQIQIAGATASDEFVELYNPTSQSINMANWKLKRKSSGGSNATLTTFSGIINPAGYFLLANNNYDGGITPDISYSLSIGSNNALYLFDENSLLQDLVGMGTPFESETSPAPEPSPNNSIKRISFQDTNNNSADFEINLTPNPRNTSSIVNPSPSSSPLISPTPSPTVSPLPSVSPSPSINASPTPSPTTIPSPSTTPTMSPSLTPSASPTPTPSASPSPTSEKDFIFPQINLICRLTYYPKKVAWIVIQIPQVKCEAISLH